MLAGYAGDAEHALEVVKASEAATGCAVAEVRATARMEPAAPERSLRRDGRALVAKVPASQNQGYFAKTEFQIDLVAGTCTCPAKQVSRDLRPANGGGGPFVFAAEVCMLGPLRAHCVRGQGGRSVQVHPYEALLQQARELQAGPLFDEARQRRQVVEHRIARLAQQGIRQARYFGQTKTLFQLCLVAAVANLTLLAATSNPLVAGGSGTLGSSPLGTPQAFLGGISLLLSFWAVQLVASRPAHLHQPSHAPFPLVCSLTPSSRPGF